MLIPLSHYYDIYECLASLLFKTIVKFEPVIKLEHFKVTKPMEMNIKWQCSPIQSNFYTSFDCVYFNWCNLYA